MERYNKVLLCLWLLFSAATLAIMTILVLNNLAKMLEAEEMLGNEGLALSFLLLFIISEVIGAVLAAKVIDHVLLVYYMHAPLAPKTAEQFSIGSPNPRAMIYSV